MAGVFSDWGEFTLLKRAVYLPPTPVDWEVRLFTNNYTPLATDDYEEPPYTEATFPGYEPQPLVGFGLPEIVGGVSRSTANEVIFTASSELVTPETVYGYWVVEVTDIPRLLWAELFVGGPVTFSAPYQSRRVSPTVTLRQLGS